MWGTGVKHILYDTMGTRRLGNLASINRPMVFDNPAKRWVLGIVRYCSACSRYCFIAWTALGNSLDGSARREAQGRRKSQRGL